MNKSIYILLLLLWPVMQSCIYDDLSDCFRERYIWFKSINTKYIYEDIAQQVNLYIYDEQQQFINELICTHDDLIRTGGKVYIPAQYEGKYWIVALVNLSDNYIVYDTEEFAHWKASLQTANGNEVSSKLPDLYHSMKAISFGQDNPLPGDTMYLSKNINHIYLTIECSASDVLENIQPYIYGSNSLFNYENRLLGDRMITYHPHNTQKYTNRMQYSITTMLLRIMGDISLYFKEQESDGSISDRKIFNITEELAKVKDSNGRKLYDSDIKLSLEDEFKFVIVLDKSSQIIDLKINDWYVVKDYVEIK